jgi:hypothetical protein
LLGHRIEVHSVEGRGSCFTIVTDAAQQNAAEKEAGLQVPLSLVQRPMVDQP